MLRFNCQASFGVLLLVLISCTIVKDSDITSVSQLNSLSLKSFEIVQNLQTGSSSALATLKYDSVASRISPPTGAHISRVKGFALPALGNHKMTLKSGANAATVVKIEYRDNNTPDRFRIFQGDSLLEDYKFFYNSNNQLIKLVVDFNPIDNKPNILHVEDDITYPVAPAIYPSTIVRKSSNATLTQSGTFTFQTCSNCGGSSAETINPVIFSQGNQQLYQINFNTGGNNCNSSNYYPYNCGGLSKSNSGGGSNGNQNQLNFQHNFTFNKTLQTFLTSWSNTDTYFFHPMMILRDVVPQGSLFFWFYSVDWFVTSNNSFANNDKVTINLNYAK
jgi:hypothetical protein